MRASPPNRFDAAYWQGRYQDQQTPWDLGAIAPPLRHYFDQLTDPTRRVLVPGGGNGYEAHYLHALGFQAVYLCDVAPQPLADFQQRHPDFPADHLLEQDFFALHGPFDLVVEHCFFCALPPALRSDYARQMHRLLVPGGQLVGLLFNDPLNHDRPPFGGSRSEYLTYFDPIFEVRRFETAHHSVGPRAGRELFIHLRRALADPA